MPDKFAIITAHATTWEIWADEKNNTQNRALQLQLKMKVRDIFEITGYAPDSDHSEPSFWADLPFDDACEIWLEFYQDAIFIVEGDELFVTYCEKRKRAKFPAWEFEQKLNKKVKKLDSGRESSSETLD